MKLGYYPGCSLSATGIEYDLSTKLVAKKMDLTLTEIPDWNCCGASAGHLTNHMLSLALPARNLALAEKEGLDTVAIPCAACFSRSKAAAEAVKASPDMQQRISDIIEMDYQAKAHVVSLLDMMGRNIGLEKIKEHVVKPLNGLKVASYYGCLLVRPPKVAQSDDTEDPTVMDEIIEAIGGERVEWGFKTECCGAGHVVAKPAIGREMIYEILKNAQLNGAQAIATACPLCMLNLDMRQKQISAQKGMQFNIPVYYFTELMALAFGFSPGEMGLSKHFVPAEKLIEETFARQRREEEA